MSEKPKDKDYEEAKKLYLAMKARRKSVHTDKYLKYYWNDEWNGRN